MNYEGNLIFACPFKASVKALKRDTKPYFFAFYFMFWTCHKTIFQLITNFLFVSPSPQTPILLIIYVSYISCMPRCSHFIYRLPIPWLIYGLINGEPVVVSSDGMVCSITILFMMLLFVIISIACFRWKMNKGLGFLMFLLYFVFVAISLMFEYEWYKCPL